MILVPPESSTVDWSFDSVWTGYVAYLDDVRAKAPKTHALRDQDRCLWGRSAATQLDTDIQCCFGVIEE